MPKLLTNYTRLFLVIGLLLSLNSNALNAACGVTIKDSVLSDVCNPRVLMKFTAKGAPVGSIYYWKVTGRDQDSTIGGAIFYVGFDSTQRSIYGIRLTVKFPDGSQCVVDKPNAYNLMRLSTPKLRISRSVLCGLSDTASFTDLTTGVAERTWYIDNVKINATTARIVHTFTDPGYHSIKLQVKGPRGCSKGINIVKAVYVPSGYNLDFCSMMTENNAHTSLTGLFSPVVDALLNITEYRWSFPGGSPATITTTSSSDQIAVYSNYNTPRDVTLTVVTDNGCTFSVTKKNLVQKYYSVAQPSYCVGDSILVHVIEDATNGKDSYSVTSSPKCEIVPKGNGNYKFKYDRETKPALTIRFKYPGSECYDIYRSLSAFIVQGAAANFTADTTLYCSLPVKVNLYTSYTKPTIGTNSYLWRIYDSAMNEIPFSPISTTDPKLALGILNKFGHYSIKLEVTNSLGCKDVFFKKDYIAIVKPVATVWLDKNPVCPGTPFLLNNREKPAETSTNTYIRKWAVKNTKTLTTDSFFTSNPMVTLMNPGKYSVTYNLKAGACESIIKMKDTLIVSGLQGSIIPTAIKTDCLPFKYNFNFKLTSIFPDTARIMGYRWEVIYGDTGIATIADSFKQNANVTFYKHYHKYQIKLTVTTSSGCDNIFYLNNFTVGTISAFKADTISCPGNIITNLKNVSLGNPDKYKWIVSPNSGYTFYPYDSAKVPQLAFNKDGKYTLRLLSKHRNENCWDTSAAVVIDVQTPYADFSAPDTILYCQPQTIVFKNMGGNGNKYVWTVNRVNPDGTRTFIANYTRSKNEDWRIDFAANGYYDITLTVTRGYGCSVSKTKKKYIRIVGAQAYFTIDDHTGCGNKVFNFTNKSELAEEVVMQYGDLTAPTDSIGPHLYKFTDFSKTTNVYYPTLFVINSGICNNFDIFTDSVVLFRPPFVKYNMQDSVGCAPFNAVFHNQTLYGDNLFIDYGDGYKENVASNQDTIRHIYEKPGTYTVTFKATTNDGCEDIITKKDYVVVNPTPVAYFTASDTNICYSDTVRFFSEIGNKVNFKSLLWTFDDGKKGSDTSSVANPVYHFSTTGLHRVKLEVTNTFGCIGIYSLIINNGDTALPLPIEINYVTVLPDGNIKLVYNKSRQWNFEKYEVTANVPNNYNTIYQSYNIKDTVLIVRPPDVNTDNKSYTFYINQENRCAFRSLNGMAHNTIFLQAAQVGSLSVQLNWSPYKGWSNKFYELYRMDESSKGYKRIALLSGNDSTYLDTPICNHTYTYYIVAFDKSGTGFKSASNVVTLPIIYILQTDPLKLFRTTVDNNKRATVTNWEPGIQKNIKFYVLDRYRKDLGWQENFAITKNTDYTDYKADIDNESYTYRVKVMDECGNISPFSNNGTSILLQSSLYNDSRKLVWNRYHEWKDGVAEYRLQLANDQGVYRTIAVLGPSDTTYTDDSSYVNIYNGTCYRVKAIRAGVNADTSFSNVRCANLTSRIFIPNVFTPNNGDDFNNYWGVFVTSISRKDFQDFSLTVYNRWGEEVWKTNDYTQTWDGTFKGQTVPMDVYLYRVKALGFDGHQYNIKGTVQVIR